ncbi:MAG TPA: hypothetical protein VKT78_12430, partial [Fimbriimonadaceae bacterium]|nr:hypothetical protein [Fimbriimonadaceae bacterium]
MKLGRLVITPVMGLAALLFMLPVLLMVLTSFKPEAEVLNPASAIPKHATLSNYAYVLQWKEEAPFGRWLLNSIFISTSVTFLVLTFASMAAFAIARLKVRGSRIILGVIVCSLLLPGQLFLIPVYLELSKLHWL